MVISKYTRFCRPFMSSSSVIMIQLFCGYCHIIRDNVRLSVARAVESAVEGALLRGSRLRQAVLRSAFEGRLV
jgi:hypothetical protein